MLGRDIPAKISNLRNVDWQGLGINFVLVFSPNAFKGAPHSHVATLSEAHPDPAGDARIIKQVAEAFPTVTSVRVREALETIGTVVTNLVLAIRGASAVTLISAILVLGGALAAGHRHRVYDAVILKTLGATRVRLLGAYALEYLMIGLATAVFGVIAGSIAAWLIVTRLMTLEFHLAGRQRRRRGRRRPGRHGRAGARRDVAGPEPEAGQRAAEFVTICSGGKAALTLLLLGNDAEATFSRAWKLATNVLVSHIPARISGRVGDVKLTSADRDI